MKQQVNDYKGYFETTIAAGKSFIRVQSFEKWYANQVKYHKIDGEEPGRELRRRSYGIRDIAGMLGISEATVYSLIKRDGIQTVLVDDWTRIPKKAFDTWYAGQNKYRTEEDRRKDEEREPEAITMPEMARLLGIQREQVYALLKSRKFGTILETVEISGKRKVTRESFQRFLDSQDQYHIIRPEGTQEPAAVTPFLTVSQAAETAGISRQAIMKAIEKECFPCLRQYGLLRIPRDGFEAWLKSRENTAVRIPRKTSED